MIQVIHQKPAQGMSRHPATLRAVPEFNQTRQAVQLLDYIDRFIAYFERTKGCKPPAVHLCREQFQVLGVQPGKHRKGVRLEVRS